MNSSYNQDVPKVDSTNFCSVLLYFLKGRSSRCERNRTTLQGVLCLSPYLLITLEPGLL